MGVARRTLVGELMAIWLQVIVKGPPLGGQVRLCGRRSGMREELESKNCCEVWTR